LRKGARVNFSDIKPWLIALSPHRVGMKTGALGDLKSKLGLSFEAMKSGRVGSNLDKPTELGAKGG